MADYQVDLNSGQWTLKGVDALGLKTYQSDIGSYHTKNGKSIAYITLNGYYSFTFYIRSDGETAYDYTEAFEVDAEPTRTKGKYTTKSKQKTDIACTYELDGGIHTIAIMYSKDSGTDSGADRGFFWVPTNYKEAPTDKVITTEDTQPPDRNMISPYGSFSFKGIDSRRYGVRVTAMPAMARAEKRIKTLAIAGRNGSLHIDEGVYDSYETSIECATINRRNIDAISAWLVGSGELILSTEPDKVYHATVINKISISQMINVFQHFVVSLEVQPFKYSIHSEAEKQTITTATQILNLGTVYSEPTITIYTKTSGATEVTLKINGTPYKVTVEKNVVIDSELMEVYRIEDSGKITDCNTSYHTAEFPILEAGENLIEWSGAVEKIEIDPKWRWL